MKGAEKDMLGSNEDVAQSGLKGAYQSVVHNIEVVGNTLKIDSEGSISLIAVLESKWSKERQAPSGLSETIQIEIKGADNSIHKGNIRIPPE